MTNKPLVSINLVSYNGLKYLKSCLNSLLVQTYHPIETLIIDNNSQDGTKDFLKYFNLKNPEIRIIFNKENLGFSRAHNLGIEQSRGDFILCLNQDVILDKDFIKKAIEIFNTDSKIAAVQGKLLKFKLSVDLESIIDTTGLLMLKNRRIISRGQGQKDTGQYQKPEEIFGTDGASPIYRRIALEDIKIEKEYFDEDFFMYKEDVDLAWRLRLFGWKAFYQPKALAYHDRSAGDNVAISYSKIIKERMKISSFAKYLAFKNQRLMQVKNEQGILLLLHLPWWLAKEFLSWIYVLIFEKYTRRAIKDFFKTLPQMLKKRKIIMSHKKLSASQMAKWFN